MKKLVLALGFFALFAIGFSSCSGDKKSKESDGTATSVNRNIRFESYAYDRIAELSDSDAIDAPGAKYVRITAEGVLPADLGESSIKHLRDSLMHLSGVKFTDDIPEPDLPAGFNLTDLQADTTDACGYVAVTQSASLVSTRVVCFQVNTESYACQAAHGNQTVRYINFNVERGEIISLPSLFKPGYQLTLTEMLRNEIRRREIPISVAPTEIGIPEAFAITPEGLSFSYDPYDITPYSEGIVTIDIKMGDLIQAGILSDRGLYIITGNTPSPGS